MRGYLFIFFLIAYSIIGLLAFLVSPWWLWALSLIMPIHAVYLYNISQVKHSILRNFPVVGHLRYFFESIRPEIRQYFFESDLDGKPFNRRQRSIVYQRSKNQRQTVPFGMQINSQEQGVEWIAHSMFPVKVKEDELRVLVGGRQCTQPYNASIFNISAMSYGALSKAAVRALNGGARLGHFAHNTGEGGVSPYHTEEGGDLIWQIGTGYFGCRDKHGNFDNALFMEQANHPNIKMIELKLSQGAKPGHGGLLPAEKNTEEIAKIRKVEPNTTVASPPSHSAFSDYNSLLSFISRLRELSGGKPVGIKLCIGYQKEFTDLCSAMHATRIFPDFISIDGSEGGTGAAPLEFTDSLGMPLYDALAFAHHELIEYDIRKEIKLIAAGKIITAVDIIKAIALGADLCYSARGMMFALGCIQALQCDSGKCPVGIATQDKKLVKGLDVSDKKVRVYNFHHNTIKSTIEVMEACGFKTLSEITADKIYRRTISGKALSFREIYFKNAVQSIKKNTNLNF